MISSRLRQSAADSPEGPVPVLFLEARRAHGGDVQVLLDILGGLDGREYRALVACVPDGPVATRTDLPEDTEILPTSFGYADGASIVGKTVSLVGAVLKTRRVIKRRGVSIVHSNNTRRALSVAVALKISLPRQVRLVYHAHCEPQSSAAHRLALRLATRVWACSDFVRQSYIIAGVPSQRIALVPNGYDFRKPLPGDSRLRGRLSIPPADPIVALVGRLAPTKGQHVALEALAHAAIPSNTHLIFVGDDSISDRNEGYREKLAQRAEELGLDHRVHFVGFVSEPGPYYAVADAVVIPSEREPFGLVALEAAAACRPIVAVSRGGLVEILSTVAGLKLCDRRPPALAGLLQRALSGEQQPSATTVRDRLAEAYSLDSFHERIARELGLLVHDNVHPSWVEPPPEGDPTTPMLRTGP